MAIALAVLGVGLYGANQPLLPVQETHVMELSFGESTMIEEFNPLANASSMEQQVELETELLEEIEIPPLPIIEKTFTPPEMADLIPVEPVRETPSSPKVNPTKPESSTKSRAVVQRSSKKIGTAQQEESTGYSGPNPLIYGGGGSGDFPSPSYPASARSNGLQGVVQLLVIVEDSGIPSSVSVQSSSGHASLDSSASDHVRRLWRWPSGSMHRYIVPIRFVLQ